MTNLHVAADNIWVESEGGPLVVVPESQVARWGGIGDYGADEAGDDYGRACSIEGLIGLLDVGGQQALVLGDEPAATTYLADERLFLRWAAADSEVEIIAAARRVLREGVEWDEDEDLVWDVHETVVLFDAGWPGAELEADNHLVVGVEGGRYRVRATYVTDDSNWMFLVQLQPRGWGDSSAR